MCPRPSAASCSATSNRIATLPDGLDCGGQLEALSHQVRDEPLRVAVVGHRTAQPPIERPFQRLGDGPVLVALVDSLAGGLPIDAHRLQRAPDAERPPLLHPRFGAREGACGTPIVQDLFSLEPRDGDIDRLARAASAGQAFAQLPLGEFPAAERGEPVRIRVRWHDVARHGPIVARAPQRQTAGPCSTRRARS